MFKKINDFMRDLTLLAFEVLILMVPIAILIKLFMWLVN